MTVLPPCGLDGTDGLSEALDYLIEIVVSPTGCAHFGADYGITACGRDATPDGWWWPL